MKTKIRRIVSLCLCALLLLMVSLPMKADAAGIGELAGAYGTLSGTCVQDTNNSHALNTTTTVTKNEDGSRLRTGVTIADGSSTPQTEYHSSEPNVTLFRYTYQLYVSISSVPQLAYCSHEIYGNPDPDECYVYYEVVELEFP